MSHILNLYTIVDEQGRPPINEAWPEPIKQVLHQSFDPDIDKRPSIQLFYNMLRFQLLNLRDGDDTKLDNAFIKRRRSFGSIRNLDPNGNGEQQSSSSNNEKFPQRMKNTILSHVKHTTATNATQASSPTSTPASNGNDVVNVQQQQPQRRMRNKLRDKFRLSVKHEE